MAQHQSRERAALAFGVSGYGQQHVFACVRPVPRIECIVAGKHGRYFCAHAINLYHCNGCVNSERWQSGILLHPYWPEHAEHSILQNVPAFVPVEFGEQKF